jgi:ubiquinone/menaquinone biosynthesis C-methylase UbiE
MLPRFRRLLKVLHPEGIPRLGTPFYNAVSRREVFQRHYEMVAKDILIYCPVGSILDIGTGPGWLLVKLYHLCPALRLVGIDISASMVTQARKNLADLGLAGVIEVREGKSSQLPFAAESFDSVVSTGSLHHWKDPLAGLNEVYRVLKPEGYALMYDIVRDTPASILEQASREFGRLRLTLLWLHAFEEPFYSREELESLARASRFQEGLTRFVGVLCGLILKKAVGLISPRANPTQV